jgi:hypothetical protein
MPVMTKAAAAAGKIALRNLVISILTEHLGFCVWLLWNTVASTGMQASAPAFSFRPGRSSTRCLPPPPAVVLCGNALP